MTKAEFLELVQAKLRGELVSDEAGEIEFEFLLDPAVKALAEVIYELLIKEQSDGKADEGRD